MAHGTVTYILRSPPEDETQLQAFARALGTLTQEAGGPWAFLEAQETEDGRLLQVWAGPGRSEVVLTDDFAMGLRYFNVYEVAAGKTEALLTALSAAVEVRTPDSLLQEAQARPDDPAAVYALGLAGGPALGGAVELIATALTAPDAEMRSAAAQAAGLSRWGALGPLLEAQAARETQPHLQELMTLAAARCAPQT